MKRGGVIALVCLLVAGGCYLRDMRWSRNRPPKGVRPTEVNLEVTGYCPCGKCCGWKRTWYGRPVVAGGPNRGRSKAVGITASGSKAKPGTLAADTRLFPFGTIMLVPGYGYGKVEDRGSAIKGHTLDLYFRSHREARAFGRQKLQVKVWPADG